MGPNVYSICIYTFICPELLEETRRPRVDFGMQEYFGAGSEKFES